MVCPLFHMDILQHGNIFYIIVSERKYLQKYIESKNHTNKSGSKTPEYWSWFRQVILIIIFLFFLFSKCQYYNISITKYIIF